MRTTEGYLLDTNVVSEFHARHPHPAVVGFVQTLSSSQTYLSVLSLGELRKGAAMRMKRHDHADVRLSAWIDQLELSYRDRVLDIDCETARIWGELSADRTRPIVDTLLVATAIRHRLVLVTRNVRDVDDTPVRLHNPWS